MGPGTVGLTCRVHDNMLIAGGNQAPPFVDRVCSSPLMCIASAVSVDMRAAQVQFSHLTSRGCEWCFFLSMQEYKCP